MKRNKLSSYLFLNVPILIFIGVWSLVYLVYILQMYDVDRLHGYTWMILITSNLTVIFGYYISYNFHNFNKIYYDAHQAYVLRFNNKRLASLIILLFLMSIFSTLLSTYLRAQEVNGLAEYFLNPSQARHLTIEAGKEAKVEMQFFQSFLAIFKNLNFVGVILGGILFASSGKYRFVSFLPIFFSLVHSAATFSRFFFIQNTFIWLCAAFYVSAYQSEEDRKRVLQSLLKMIGSLVIIVIGYFIVIILFRTNVLIKYSAKTGKIIEFLGEHIHSYFVGNLALLDRYLLERIEFYYGVSMFRNLFKWFKVIGVYDNPKIPYLFFNYEFIKTRYLLMNTYTYVRHLYSDFGEAGLITMSFIWGLISYKILILYLKKFTLLRLFILTIIAHSLFLSFFDLYLKQLIVMVYCGLILLFIERKLQCFSFKNIEKEA